MMRLILAFILLHAMQQTEIFNFNADSNLNGWYIVDDSVMGGRSQGNFILNTDDHGEFKGFISLDNNGGFSSLRYRFKSMQINQYTKFVIKLKGDGKNYQFRVKSKENQRYSYITEFKTSEEWQTIEVEFSTMYPSFRGYKLNQPNYSGETVSEIAFLIGNKKKEAFKLEIDNIRLE